MYANATPSVGDDLQAHVAGWAAVDPARVVTTPQAGKFAKADFVLGVVFTLIIGRLVVYVWECCTFQRPAKAVSKTHLPPLLPSIIPRYGTALSYLLWPAHLINKTLRNNAKEGLIRIKLTSLDLVCVFGASNVADLLRNSASALPLAHWYILRHLGGMPDKAAEKHLEDDSGFKPEPNPLSNVKPNNRIDLFVHQVLLELLRSANVERIFERYAELFKRQIDNLDIGDEWVDMPDFFSFMTSQTTPPQIETVCGRFMLDDSPDFIDNLWEYNSHLSSIIKQVPRLFNPRPYRLREALLGSIKRWHAHATAESAKGDQAIDETFDRVWGTKFFRDRHATFSQVDDYDATAIAAQDLSGLWGATANAFTSAFWACYETYSSPSALSRARLEAQSCLSPTPHPRTDFCHALLLRQPLLQSIYAETLRLHVIIYIYRSMAEQSLRIGPWTLPPRTHIITSSSVAHFDKNEWNEGRGGEHPVEEFWADRFLVWEGDGMSGPKRKTEEVERESEEGGGNGAEDDVGARAGPKFSMQGMGANGSWFPYGGRPRGCFGRHLARREILLIVATMVVRFDVEFTSGVKATAGEDDFGLGAQRPMKKVPFRIRRRRGPLV